MITEKPSKIRIAALVFLLVFFAATMIFTGMMKPAMGQSVTPMTDHWIVETPSQTYADIELSEAALGEVRDGDWYYLRNKLPAEEVDGGCLQIMTMHAAIAVSVNGEPIYESGSEYADAGTMTPTLFHFVNLPEGYGGKDFQIALRANEDSAFSGLYPVYAGNINELHLYYINNYRLILLCSLFLVITGIMMSFIFFFLWNYYSFEPRMLFSALISFFLGLYVMAYHELSDFIIAHTTFNDFCEYFSLFLMPLLFNAFMSTLQTGSAKKPYLIMAAIDLVMVTVLFALHLTNLAHINLFIPLIHLTILIEGSIVLFLSVRNAIRRRKNREETQAWQISDRVLVICFFIMLVFAMIDIVRYLLQRYFFAGGSAYADLTFLIIGALIFIVGLFINFFYYHIERISSAKTTEHLAGLAYTDPLTGMANRSRCDTLLNELNETGEEFTVVSMDVNYLKRINDTFGHSRGDKYLVDMAGFIRNAFPDAALHGRMGGDEFIVVLRGNVPQEYKTCITAMKQAIREKNESETEVRYGISYGVAYTYETKEHTLQATYEIADMRMYEMKKIRHAQEDGHVK